MAGKTMTSSTQKRRATFLGAAAVAALIAGGAIETGLVAPSTAHAELRSMQQPLAMPSFADVIDRVKPAVVSVRVKMQQVADRSQGSGDEDGDSDGPSFNFPNVPPGSPLDRLFRDFRGQLGPQGRNDRQPRGEIRQAQGSGFFISADGYLVTNNHVVENGSQVQIVLDDGATRDAKVVGTDPKTDLALLKVEGSDFPYVKLASQKARVGDWVLAVGNPFGLGGTVTAGIVSAQHRDIGQGPYDDFLQIDAPINRGNSGGPTFNLAGEVVGVNTAIFSPSGGNVGIAFAIPASTVDTVVSSIQHNGGVVTRGFIGVQMQPVTKEIAEAIGLKEPKGALVAEALKDSPAAKAGIKTGDTIIAVDGETVKEAKDLSKKIAAVAPGKSVNLTIYRKGEERTVSVEVGKQPKA